MAKHDVHIGQTDYSVLVFIRDSTSHSGAPKTGLDHTKVDFSYTRVETDNDVAMTGSISPVSLASLTAAHTDWGFKEVDATESPGLYRLDIADGVFASGAWSAVVFIRDAGTNNVAPVALEFQLVGQNPQNAVQAADVTQISGDSAAADNLETMLDGTGGSTLSLGRFVVTALGADAAVDIRGSTGRAVYIEAGEDSDAVHCQSGLGASALALIGSLGYGLYASGHTAGALFNGEATGHGAIFKGGSTSGDGLRCNVTSGAELRSNIVGNLTGNIAGNVTGSVNSVSTGVALANAAQGGAATVLTLKQLVINNTQGAAVDIEGSTGIRIDSTNGDGIEIVAVDGVGLRCSGDVSTGSAGAIFIGGSAGDIHADLSGTVDGFTTVAKGQIQTEAEEALQTYHLDHLIAAADPGSTVANNSFLAKLVSKNTPAAFTSYNNTTDSLEAQRDRVLAKGTDITGFNDLSASQVNSECDTALADVGLNTTVTGRIDAAITTRATPAQVNSECDTALADVGLTPTVTGRIDAAITTRATPAQVNAECDTALADAGLTTTVTGRIDAAISTRATPAQVNTEMLDVISMDTPIDGRSIESALRIIGAAVAGRVTGAGTGTETFKGFDETTTRIVVSCDANGNRNDVVYS